MRMGREHLSEPHSASLHAANGAAEQPVPPLQSLRTFEACARHASFVRAAEELAITPSAVTHHIRLIEKWVGSPLFKRTGRSVELTPRAAAALSSLHEGFSRIAAGARILKEPDRRTGAVAISTAPSFASKWLLPRLDRFREQNPRIEVWVSADLSLVDFSKSDIDIAIRYGSGAYEGLVAEKLLSEGVLAVASPDLIAAHGPFLSPADLLKAPLLHNATPGKDPSCPDWPMWLRARGVESPAAARGARYNQSSLVLEEALAGKGVALAKRVHASADLASGKVKALFDETTPLSSAYWLVWPRDRTLEAPIKAFSAWIRREIQNDEQIGLARSTQS